MTLRLTCHGCRGSSPVAGSQFDRYGGLTTCFEIVVPGLDRRVLVDGGTGLQEAARTGNGSRYALMLTHAHWDHTQGIPFFEPLYDGGVEVDIYADPAEGLGAEQLIDSVMRPPWFPVSFVGTASVKRYHTMDGSSFTLGPLTVTTARLHHPSGVTAYRFDHGASSVVIATDVECGPAWSDHALIDLARGADLLVHDAQYLPDEYERDKKGWGHSTWETATDIARRAEVGRLILTSHDPSRADPEIDEILTLARSRFPATDAARQQTSYLI